MNKTLNNASKSNAKSNCIINIIIKNRINIPILLFFLISAFMVTIFSGCGAPGKQGETQINNIKVKSLATAKGLGSWTGKDKVDPSSKPPLKLSPNNVPMFVSLGFDDNGFSGLEGSGGQGGMSWILDVLRDKKNADGSKARVSFYMTSSYIENPSLDNENTDANTDENADENTDESVALVKKAWQQAAKDGHELGNHTHAHDHGAKFTTDRWRAEMQECNNWLTKPFDPNESIDNPDITKGVGYDQKLITGFRTPFLETNDPAFFAMTDLGFHYDCSIEEGWQEDQDGTNFFWPFTLDNGSPGHDILVEWGLRKPISSHPGLWEMPAYPVIVPPDSECEKYQIPQGLRSKLKNSVDYFDKSSGKITGFDYNLWVSFGMTKNEVVATLKYTLDLRLKGNRAPFMLGGHSDIYSNKYDTKMPTKAHERREAIEEFIEYALSKTDVQIQPVANILNWVRNPVPLNSVHL